MNGATLLLRSWPCSRSRVWPPPRILPEQILQQAVGFASGRRHRRRYPAIPAYLKLPAPIRPTFAPTWEPRSPATGRYAEAIVEYQAALKARAERSSHLAEPRAAFYKEGQIADAAQELASLHAVQRANPQVVLLLRGLLAPAGRERQSHRSAGAARPAKPGRPCYRLSAGMALLRDKQIDRGNCIVDRILRMATRRRPVCCWNGQARSARYPAAIARYHQSRGTEPRSFRISTRTSARRRWPAAI